MHVTKSQDIDWRKHKRKLNTALDKLTEFIESESSRPQSDNSKTILNIAIEDRQKLADIAEKLKETSYLKHPDYKLVIYYTHDYMHKKGLVLRQRLTPAGISCMYQAMTSKQYDCRTLMQLTDITPIIFADITNGCEADKDIIDRLFSTLGIAPDASLFEYPLVTDKAIVRPKYDTKADRNAAIVAMYLSGKGLRQLEREGFGVKSAGIRKILIDAGVYNGAKEGLERNKLGGWSKQQAVAHDRIKRMSASKSTTANKIRHNLFNKRVGAGLSQQQMADSLGCSRAYYNMVENGKEEPSEAMWQRIEGIFGLDGGCLEIRVATKVKKLSKKTVAAKVEIIEDTVDDDPDDPDVYIPYGTNIDNGCESAL